VGGNRHDAVTCESCRRLKLDLHSLKVIHVHKSVNPSPQEGDDIVGMEKIENEDVLFEFISLQLQKFTGGCVHVQDSQA